MKSTAPLASRPGSFPALARSARRRPAAGLLLLALAAGCATPGSYHLTDRTCVSTEVAARFGQEIGPARCPGSTTWPYGIAPGDELSEEATVMVALWNNAAFAELLTELGIARGDLVQAGLLPNPELVYFFPVSDKPFKYLFDLPIEAIWLRPIREAAAAREVGRVRQRLTQAGLDLIRDTRQAYADLVLAHGRNRVATDAVQLRERIAQLARVRLDAGDISPQEATAAEIDAGRARQDSARAGFDVRLAEERLRNLMGMGEDRSPVRVDLGLRTFPAPLVLEELTAEAIVRRPDALAAAQASAAATERLRLARIGWMRFLGIADATSGRGTGHEFGPAFRVMLPLLNRNQGGIARAEAELEQAERRRQTVRNQIVLDVQQAHWRFSQAQAELLVLDGQVRPAVEDAIRRTENAYLNGNTNYVVVLQTAQQLIDSRNREVQLLADLRRAWADLERSVGRHLADLPPAPPRPETPPVAEAAADPEDDALPLPPQPPADPQPLVPLR